METNRVLEEQMVLFDSLAPDAALNPQVEEDEEVTATAAFNSIEEEGEGWEGEENWEEEGVAEDDKLQDGGSDGQSLAEGPTIILSQEELIGVSHTSRTLIVGMLADNMISIVCRPNKVVGACQPG